MSAPATPPAAIVADALDMLWVDVPVGSQYNPVDHYHVLDMHAGDPVRMSCRHEGHEIHGAQVHGDINLLPAGALMRWVVAAPAKAVILRLAPAIFDEAADALSLKPSCAQPNPAMRMRDPHIEHLGWMVKEEKFAGSPRGRLWLDSVAYTMALRLVRRSERPLISSHSASRVLPKWRLRNVRDYIDAHLDKDLSLAELAAVSGFSVPHFTALFRQSTGMSVHRYVVEQRVERARRLLLEGERPMSAIALDLGFAHQSHMTRCVQRVLGITPSQIVALCR